MMMSMGNELKNILLHLRSCKKIEEALLRGYILGELDDECARLVSEHLEHCSICKMTVVHLRNLLKNESYSIPETVLARVELNIHKKYLQIDKSPSESLKDGFMAILKWLISPSKVAVLLSVFLVILLGGIYVPKIFKHNIPHQLIVRGGVQLVAEFPSGKLNTIPSKFKWSKVPQAYYYSIQIYSQSYVLILKINNIKRCQYHFDDNEKKIFNFGESYFWNVKCYDVTGNLIGQSNLIKIKIPKIEP